MDRETKSFIVASLCWLALGAGLGVAMTLNLGNFALVRFAHMHLLLLGFMAMMVYGVGYFILPRFNGVSLRWPRLVAPHFWLSNLGLVGLVFGAVDFRPLFALISFSGVLLFVVNLVATLLGAPALEQRLERQGTAGGNLAAPASANPVSSASAAPAQGSAPVPAELTGRENIGELLAQHPECEEVFRLFFGDGCFSCPGQATESLAQAASMHNIDVELLLDALRQRMKR